jgi:hypothetical protein
MKKILLPIILLASGNGVFSQNLKETVVSENNTRPAAVSNANISEHTSPIDVKTVNLRAVRHLKKTFKDVNDEKWYDMPDGYRANFTVKDIRYRLDYDMNGTWMHTIMYYDEKKLPTDVRRLVASNYLDYTIRTVEAIEIPQNIKFYVIHLEGETNWINIKVSDSEIFELEKIKKS